MTDEPQMHHAPYITSHTTPEHPYLHALWRATHLHLNYPRMASGHLQGEVLRMLVLMLRPRLVLEIGTFTGYSALAMASAMEPGTMLHTFEINDEQEDFTRPWIEQSPWADRITFHIGDALEFLGAAHRHPSLASTLSTPTMQAREMQQAPFDLVFIDADKRHYVDYYDAVLPHVRPGGFILADNTLWGGQVLNAPAPDFPPIASAHGSAPDGFPVGSPSLTPSSAPDGLPVGSLSPSSAPDGFPVGSPSLTLNAKSSQLQGILAFNDHVAADSRVEQVILPLRDGLTIIRRNP